MRQAMTRHRRLASGVISSMVLIAGVVAGLLSAAHGVSAAVSGTVSTDIEMLLLASPVALPPEGGNVTFTYLVKNVGSQYVSNVAVTNDLGTLSCATVKYMNGDLDSDGTLNPGTEWTFFCKTRVTSSGIHTAVATGTWGSGARVSVPSSIYVFVNDVIAPNVHLHVEAFPAVLHSGGGTASLKYEVGNIGDTPVSDIGFSGVGCRLSALVEGDANLNGLLDTNESWTYVCDGEFSATSDLAVSFTGKAGGLAVTDTALVTVVVGSALPHPSIHLHAVANPARLPASGGTTYLTYHVENDGDVPLADVGMFSGSPSCVAPTYAGGDADKDGLLDLDERWSFVCVERLVQTEAGSPLVRGRAGGKWVNDNALFVIPVAASWPPSVDPTATGAYGRTAALAATPDVDTDLGLEIAPAFGACIIGVPYKVASDGNPQTQDDAAVYYCGRDGKRHAFPNGKVFLSWYPDFDNVRIMDAAALRAMPLGDAVRYRPGSWLVKAPGDPKVYAVSRGGLLRWVADELMAESLYGGSWRTMIDDVPSAFFGTRYLFGNRIDVALK
jgi:archaellum component FlaG (FlaF/FlaG flagellin family)